MPKNMRRQPSSASRDVGRSLEVADEDVRPERAQGVRALVVVVDEGPHRQVLLTQQAHDAAADAADASAGACDQDWWDTWLIVVLGAAALDHGGRSEHRRSWLAGVGRGGTIGRVTSPGRVGRYEIRRVIGRGGMATVYQAYESDLDRDVALKELTLGAGSGREAARRFLREARLAGSFSHPNIVTVHEYFEHGGTPYIAMEYLVARDAARLRRALVAAAGGRRPRRPARRARLRRRARRRASRSQAREPHGHLAGAREGRRLRDRPRDQRDADREPHDHGDHARDAALHGPRACARAGARTVERPLLGRRDRLRAARRAHTVPRRGGTDRGAAAAHQRPGPARDLARARRRPGPLGLGRPPAGEGARAAHALGRRGVGGARRDPDRRPRPALAARRLRAARTRRGRTPHAPRSRPRRRAPRAAPPSCAGLRRRASDVAARRRTTRRARSAQRSGRRTVAPSTLPLPRRRRAAAPPPRAGGARAGRDCGGGAGDQPRARRRRRGRPRSCRRSAGARGPGVRLDRVGARAGGDRARRAVRPLRARRSRPGACGRRSSAPPTPTGAPRSRSVARTAATTTTRSPTPAPASGRSSAPSAAPGTRSPTTRATTSPTRTSPSPAVWQGVCPFGRLGGDKTDTPPHSLRARAACSGEMTRSFCTPVATRSSRPRASASRSW